MPCVILLALRPKPRVSQGILFLHAGKPVDRPMVSSSTNQVFKISQQREPRAPSIHRPCPETPNSGEHVRHIINHVSVATTTSLVQLIFPVAFADRIHGGVSDRRTDKPVRLQENRSNLYRANAPAGQGREFTHAPR